MMQTPSMLSILDYWTISNMDIAENINYTFEEQSFYQLETLRQVLTVEDANSKAVVAGFRLFRQNEYEEIDPEHRRQLFATLKYLLLLLGNQLENNLMLLMRAPTSDISTSTPVRDLTPVSSRAPSSTPQSSRDNSKIEVIVISSDEDESEEENKPIIKQEPIVSDRSDRRFTRSTRSPELPETFNEDVLADVKVKPVLIVDRLDSANFYCDKMGRIMLRSRSSIKLKAVKTIPRHALLLHIVSKVIHLIDSDNYMSKRELYYLSLKHCCFIKKKKPAPLTQTQNTNSATQSASQFTQAGPSQASFGMRSQSNGPFPSQRLPDQQNQAKYTQTKLDIAIDDLCCLLGCSKTHLHILAQPKSLVFGKLKFTLKNGTVYDCLSRKDGLIIPDSHLPIIEVESNAKLIMIVEKDSVMQKILHYEEKTRFISRYRIILFTGKGYPCTNGRSFVNFLWSKLRIPILALTDADPHGMDIVCSYKFGTYTTAYEGPYSVTPQIRWLGLLPGDIERLEIPIAKTLPLTPRDYQKINSLMARPYMVNREKWQNQLNIMMSLGRKAELESLDGEYLVETYLPNKIRYASWL